MTQDFDWGKILESDSESEAGEVPSLVEPRQNPIAHYGITINHPRTKKFLNLDSRGQQILYNRIWYNIKNTLGIPIESDFAFEYCESGQVHLHAYVSIQTKHFINGAVSDLAKSVHRQLPKKYEQFKEGQMYPKYHRYKSPSHVIQYYDDELHDVNNRASIDYWRAYIKKQQN